MYTNSFLCGKYVLCFLTANIIQCKTCDVCIYFSDIYKCTMIPSLKWDNPGRSWAIILNFQGFILLVMIIFDIAANLFILEICTRWGWMCTLSWTIVNVHIKVTKQIKRKLGQYDFWQPTCLNVYLKSRARNCRTGNWEFDSNLLKWILTKSLKNSVNFST